MKKYKILEHEADLKIMCFGKTKKELFLNALFGMTENQRPEIEKNKKTKRKIKIKSLDFSTLLVDFLNEVLYLSQLNKEVFFKIKFVKFTDNEIEGEISGQKVEKFNQDIKAVTYHNLEIFKTKNSNWQAIILFDI